MAKGPDTPIPSKEYGDSYKFDPTFNGPLHRRSCTNIICLLLFIIFIVIWVAVGIYAIKHGDVHKLLVPTDSYGKKCGFDSGVKDKPYLVFFNLLECISPTVPVTGCPTHQVCVKTCPSQTIIKLFDDFSVDLPIDELKQKVVCRYEVDLNKISSKKELIKYMNENKCASYTLKSKPVSNRCIPLNFSDVNNIRKDLKIDINLLEENMNLLSKLNQIGVMIIEDLVNFRWWIVVALISVMIVCFIYIVLMRWIAGTMLWLSIIGALGVLGYCSYISYVQYIYWKDNPVQLTTTSSLKGITQSVFEQKETWLVIFIIITAILVIILLSIIFLRKRILLAIALIKEGSKAVSCIKSTLFFPIFPWVFQCIIVATSIIFLLYLNTIGDPTFKAVISNNNITDVPICNCEYKTGDICTPSDFNEKCKDCANAVCHFVGIISPNHVKAFFAIIIVGFFWFIFFVEGLGQMILASTFATWYWTFKKSDVPFFTLLSGTYRTIRYHLGTIAFGSLIITICRLIRLFLEYVDHKLKKYDNAITRAIMCCLKCCFACLESFLKFINKNAYIMCAVHGKGFFGSAVDAFNLLMRNVVRVFVLDKVTSFLFFLSKVFIAIGCGTATYFAFKSEKIYEFFEEKNQLHYDFVPVLIISIAAYIIASIFFSVYDMAVDTLFLCFLEDSERNDGSPDKPYFMSKQLMKLLGKKNK